MKLFKFPANVTISLIIGGLIVIFATFPNTFFPLLSLEHNKLAQGELWRIVTSSLVHFGWAHALMNLSAFAIFVFALGNAFSTSRFIALILFCCSVVGISIYWLNPEYETYAGLSGAVHGFFVAGFFVNKRHTWWLNSIFICVIVGKVFMEHQPGYHTTELQALLPVAVAYDAHLYGAVAGLVFGVYSLIIDKFLPKSQPG